MQLSPEDLYVIARRRQAELIAEARTSHRPHREPEGPKGFPTGILRGWFWPRLRASVQRGIARLM